MCRFINCCPGSSCPFAALVLRRWRHCSLFVETVSFGVFSVRFGAQQPGFYRGSGLPGPTTPLLKSCLSEMALPLVGDGFAACSRGDRWWCRDKPRYVRRRCCCCIDRCRCGALRTARQGTSWSRAATMECCRSSRRRHDEACLPVSEIGAADLVVALFYGL